MTKWLGVFVGGGLGSLCRYALTALTLRMCGEGFGWGTLGVNLVGCLLIGLGYGLIEQGILPESVRFLVITGFLGGLTTFSTYTWESFRYFQDGMLNRALVNILANNAGGLILAVVGLGIARRIAGA